MPTLLRELSLRPSLGQLTRRYPVWGRGYGVSCFKCFADRIGIRRYRIAERKLRLRVRQYGERYLWFESISLHQAVRKPLVKRDEVPLRGLRLSVLRSPVYGGAPDKVDDAAAKAVAGVIDVVRLPYGVARR